MVHIPPNSIITKPKITNYNTAMTLVEYRVSAYKWHPISNLIARFNGANMRPIWGLQDPGGSHVGPMNFVIWVTFTLSYYLPGLQKDLDSNRDAIWSDYYRVQNNSIVYCNHCDRTTFHKFNIRISFARFHSDLKVLNRRNIKEAISTPCIKSVMHKLCHFITQLLFIMILKILMIC